MPLLIFFCGWRACQRASTGAARSSRSKIQTRRRLALEKFEFFSQLSPLPLAGAFARSAVASPPLNSGAPNCLRWPSGPLARAHVPRRPNPMGAADREPLRFLRLGWWAYPVRYAYMLMSLRRLFRLHCSFIKKKKGEIQIFKSKGSGKSEGCAFAFLRQNVCCLHACFLGAVHSTS